MMGEEIPINANGQCVPLDPTEYEKDRIRKFYFWSLVLLIIWEVILLAVAYSLNFVASLGAAARQDISVSSGEQFSKVSDLIFDDAFVSIVLNMVGALCASFSVVLIGSKVLGFSVLPSFKKANVTVWQLIRYAVIILGLQILSGYIISFIENLFYYSGVEMTEADFDTNRSFPSALVTILYTCAIAPVFEELLFRGFILRNMSRVSQRFGIISSAILFGLFHMNIPQFVSATFFGLVIGYVAIKSDSIFPCIILHAFNNCFAMLQSMFYDNASQSAINKFSIVYTVVIAVAAIFCLIIASAKEDFPHDTKYQKKRTWKLLFTSFPCFICIALLIGMMLLLSF